MSIPNNLLYRLLSQYMGQNVLRLSKTSQETEVLNMKSIKIIVSDNYIILKDLSLLSDKELRKIHSRIFGSNEDSLLFRVERESAGIRIYKIDSDRIMQNVYINTFYGSIVTNTLFLKKKDDDNEENYTINIGDMIGGTKPVPYTVIDLIRSWGYALPFDELTLKDIKNDPNVHVFDGVHLHEVFIKQVCDSVYFTEYDKDIISSLWFGNMSSHQFKQESVISYVDRMINLLASETRTIYGRMSPIWSPRHTSKPKLKNLNDKLRLQDITEQVRIYKEISKSLQRGSNIIPAIHELKFATVEDFFRFNNDLFVVPNDDRQPHQIVESMYKLVKEWNEE